MFAYFLEFVSWNSQALQFAYFTRNHEFDYVMHVLHIKFVFFVYY